MKKISGFFLFLMMGMTAAAVPARAGYQEGADAMKQNAAKPPDPARTADFERGIAELAASGILEAAVHAGDKAPDFRLKDLTGKDVSLSGLLAKGPVVLVWYRGGWCPYCNLHLRSLQKALPDFEKAGAQLAAVSPEVTDKGLVTKQKDELQFTILSDPGNVTARAYGIVFTLPDYVAKRYAAFFNIREYNGDDSQTLPLAASYVIRQDGTVAYAFLDADYKKRAEPETLLKEVQKLNN